MNLEKVRERGVGTCYVQEDDPSKLCDFAAGQEISEITTLPMVRKRSGDAVRPGFTRV